MSLRILHILDHSWPLLSGYSVRSRSLVTAQHRLGMRPSVLTGPLHQIDDVQACDTTVDGVSYRRTGIAAGVLSRPILKRWPVAREAAVVHILRRKVLEILRYEEFDVVHAHSPALCGLAAWQATRRRAPALVYEIRAFWEDAAVDQRRTHATSVRYQLSRKLETFVARRADAVVGIARNIVEEMQAREIAADRLFHIPNGVDVERFSPLAPDSEIAARIGLRGEPVLAFFGTLYRYEGISWLVDAVAELRRRGLDFKLLIAGEGEDASAIEAATHNKGASKYVTFLGKIPHDQIQRYYSVSDILVYPRLSVRLTELVTPLKPLEAMAQAKAVLASGVGGMRELVQPEVTALLFEAGNIDDFCRQAERLIRQSTLRRQLGEQARERIRAEKDWKILARGYEQIYETAIRHKRLH